MVKEECLLNVVGYLWDLSVNCFVFLLRVLVCPHLCPVEEQKSKASPNSHPAFSVFHTPQRENVHHLEKVGQKGERERAVQNQQQTLFF